MPQCRSSSYLSSDSNDKIFIELSDNPPPISQELENFLPLVKGPDDLLVGFNDTDIGDGPGIGSNQIVAFSFAF